jgi:hypothetical protein
LCIGMLLPDDVHRAYEVVAAAHPKVGQIFGL